MKIPSLILLLIPGSIYAQSQTANGSSSISFNASGTAGAADCETDLDANTDTGYYAAHVGCIVYDVNSNKVASGVFTDEGDRNGSAAVALSFTTTPGFTYTVHGSHSALLTTPYDAPPGAYGNYYYDYANFFHYTEDPTIDNSNEYTFFGPGPQETSQKQTVLFAPTTAVGRAPASAASCKVPTGETTTYVRQALANANYNPSGADFLQTLVGAVDNGATVKEDTNAQGHDTCHFYNSTYPALEFVSGTTWTIGGSTPNQPESQVVNPGSGQWGADTVGYPNNEVRYYQQQRPAGGYSLPCGTTVPQQMSITCPGQSSPTAYTSGQQLTITVDSTGVTDCRAGVCSPHTAVTHN